MSQQKYSTILIYLLEIKKLNGCFLIIPAHLVLIFINKKVILFFNLYKIIIM